MTSAESNDISGIFLCDKPSGWTSHDAVLVLRKKLGIQKIGHSGTLDPMATGLLVMLIGKATKRQNELQQAPKVYEGTFTFGSETDTWDAEGKTVSSCGIGNFDIDDITKTLEKFTGDITQLIPPYSATKVGGIPMHRLARKQNRIITNASKDVTVYSWDDVVWEKPNLKFRVSCSTGTYIRSLAYEIGRELNSCAHLSALKRVQVATFSLKDAMSADILKESDREDILSKIIK
jgi:tRNA pseudouridine55 synthase